MYSHARFNDVCTFWLTDARRDATTFCFTYRFLFVVPSTGCTANLRYGLGHGIVLTYIAIGWLSSLVYTILMRRENRARDRGERDEVIDGFENENKTGKNVIQKCNG